MQWHPLISMANVKPITTLLAAMTPKEAPKAVTGSQVSFVSVLGNASKDIAKTAQVSDSPEPPTLPATSVAGKKGATTSGPIAQSKTPDLTSQPVLKEVVASTTTKTDVVAKAAAPQVAKAKKVSTAAEVKPSSPLTSAAVTATIANPTIVAVQSTTAPVAPEEQTISDVEPNLVTPALKSSALAVPEPEDGLFASSPEPVTATTSVEVTSKLPEESSNSTISIADELTASDTTLPANLQKLVAEMTKAPTDTSPTPVSKTAGESTPPASKSASRKKTVGITKQSDSDSVAPTKLSASKNSLAPNTSKQKSAAATSVDSTASAATIAVAPANQTTSSAVTVAPVAVSSNSITATSANSSPIEATPSTAAVPVSDTSATTIADMIAANPTVATTFAVVQDSAASTAGAVERKVVASTPAISDVEDFKASIGSPTTTTAVALVVPIVAKASADTANQESTQTTEQPDPVLPVSHQVAAVTTPVPAAIQKSPATTKKAVTTSGKPAKTPSQQAVSDNSATAEPEEAKSESSSTTAKEVGAQVAQMTSSDPVPTSSTTATDVDKTTGTQPLTRQETLKVVQQITDRTQLLAATRPQNGLTIHLQPEGLGSVTAVVKTVGNVVDAAFSASNDHVRQALSDSKADLTQAMQKHGMSVATVTVSAQTDSSANGRSQQNSTFTNSNTSNFNQSSSQGQQQQGSNTANASRSSFSGPSVSSTTSTPTTRAATASGVDYLI